MKARSTMEVPGWIPEYNLAQSRKAAEAGRK